MKLGRQAQLQDRLLTHHALRAHDALVEHAALVVRVRIVTPQLLVTHCVCTKRRASTASRKIGKVEDIKRVRVKYNEPETWRTW